MEKVLDKVVDRIVETTNPDKIILFGSRSRGLERPDSDYDILILIKGIKNRRLLAQQIYKNIADIPAAVDVLVETPEKVEQYRNTRNYVYSDAANGQVLYER